jgi:cation:H+ antiporter
VLGITALVAPLPVQKHLLREEGPVLLLITALAGLCLYDGWLHRGESIALALLVIPLLMLVVKYKGNHTSVDATGETEEIPKFSMGTAICWFLAGLVVLLVSAEITVWGAKSIALELGVSELIVGLTVVAIGTSLPELAASVMSALRGHHDIAIGNIFGSNLFNLMLVMASAGAIAPMALTPEVFTRDFAVMALMTIMMVAMIALALRQATKNNAPARLTRSVGLMFLVAYGFYYVLLWPSV